MSSRRLSISISKTRLIAVAAVQKTPVTAIASTLSPSAARSASKLQGLPVAASMVGTMMPSTLTGRPRRSRRLGIQVCCRRRRAMALAVLQARTTTEAPASNSRSQPALVSSTMSSPPRPP